jgi:hypothetical protein
MTLFMLLSRTNDLSLAFSDFGATWWIFSELLPPVSLNSLFSPGIHNFHVILNFRFLEQVANLLEYAT